MKFSIRDLLLVTVIVGLALGWWANRRQWQSECESRQSERDKYRSFAGTLERILKLEGYTVEWGDWYEVRVTKPEMPKVHVLKTWTYSPSEPVYHVSD